MEPASHVRIIWGKGWSDGSPLADPVLGNQLVRIFSAEVAHTHRGHDNVTPMSVHGGAGRAGGGLPLGEVRGPCLHRRLGAIRGPAYGPGVIVEHAARLPV